MHSIVLLCKGIKGEAIDVEATIDSYSPFSPPENSVVRGSESVSWFYDTFLESYEETVDTIVDLQITNWNYIPRYNAIDESEIDGMCSNLNNAHVFSSVPKFVREKLQTKTAPKPPGIQTYQTDFTMNASLPDGFQHDSVTDIDRYFTELTEGCSQDIPDGPKGASLFEKECLDALKSIVYGPRCTTRFDSRVSCNGRSDTDENSMAFLTPGELIRDHFGHDSLNIVIIGAGPIGLILANALTMLPQRQKQGIIPPIRILILESRADSPGMKRAYSRNWQANLNLLHFRNTVDPRLTRIFASLTEGKDDYQTSQREFVLPLNVIETLVLLSNKDMGATKFLFGVNQLDLVDDLKSIPNLVLVDGTGHRLEPLRRGDVCDGFGEDIDDDCDAQRANEVTTIKYNFKTPPAPEIPWLNDENDEFYSFLKTFDLDFSATHHILSSHGHSLAVAESGDIMYPVDEETEAPKTIFWIDVHGATLTKQQMLEDNVHQKENLYANNGEFCDWCKSWYDDQKEMGKGSLQENGEFFFDFQMMADLRIDWQCTMMCYTEYFSSSIPLLREDIQSSIREGSFNNSFVHRTDGWFPIQGYSFNPSTEMARQVQRILKDNGYSRDPVGMPLRDLYPALLDSIDAKSLSSEDLELVSALRQICLHSNGTKWPTVTLYTQRPFIYTNGFKKKNQCKKNSSSLGDHLDNAPMIRIGDSFTTGDGLCKLFFTFSK